MLEIVFGDYGAESVVGGEVVVGVAEIVEEHGGGEFEVVDGETGERHGLHEVAGLVVFDAADVEVEGDDEDEDDEEVEADALHVLEDGEGALGVDGGHFEVLFDGGGASLGDDD